MPALKFQHRAEPINAEDHKIVWVFYLQTVKRYQNKKQLQVQQEQERMAKKEVETQMQQFIGTSANSAYIRAPERAIRR
ncbi:unnamed protein product [Alternaria sp. RS040]